LRLAANLAWAANDITDDVAASLTAFRAKEATKHREEAILSCSSSTEAVSFSNLSGLLSIVIGGPHGTHIHRVSRLGLCICGRVWVGHIKSSGEEWL